MTPYAQWRLEIEPEEGDNIKYKLVNSSGNFGVTNATAQEIIIIRATDLLDFAKAIFPKPTTDTSSIYYITTRRFPGFDTLVAKDFTWRAFTEGRPIDPFEEDEDACDNTYEEYLEITIQYETAPQNDGDPDMISNVLSKLTVSSNASGEFLVSPIGGGAYWDDATNEENRVTRDDIPNSVKQTLVDWDVHWPQIPYKFYNGLDARLRAALGKINTTVMPIFRDAPVNTILFTGFNRTDETTWRNDLWAEPYISLDLKFTEKGFFSTSPVGTTSGVTSPTNTVTHQHIWRPGSDAIGTTKKEVVAGWHILLLKGNKLYPETDLNKLFSG